ncbi:MAG: hypothetical protein ACREC9_05260 [Methylocella sp.]
MALKRRPWFDPKSFLAMVGKGRSIGEHRTDEIVIAQGEPAYAVFSVSPPNTKMIQ